MTPREFEEIWIPLCLQAEKLAEKHGLPLTKITLMGRNPNDDKMFVCVSNEPPAGLAHMMSLPLSWDASPDRPYMEYQCPHDHDAAVRVWLCDGCCEEYSTFAEAEHCSNICRALTDEEIKDELRAGGVDPDKLLEAVHERLDSLRASEDEVAQTELRSLCDNAGITLGSVRDLCNTCGGRGTGSQFSRCEDCNGTGWERRDDE